MVHYLSPQEEKDIKRSIPWRTIEPGIVEVVRLLNTIDGLATVHSCEGHVRPIDGGISSDNAFICARMSESVTNRVLLDGVFACGIRDASLRFFEDGVFWVCLEVYPASVDKLYCLYRELR
jgi:hypothetical protein